MSTSNRGSTILVLAVLVAVIVVRLGIAEDNNRAGQRQTTLDLFGVSSDERKMIESACRALNPSRPIFRIRGSDTLPTTVAYVS